MNHTADFETLKRCLSTNIMVPPLDLTTPRACYAWNDRELAIIPTLNECQAPIRAWTTVYRINELAPFHRTVFTQFLISTREGRLCATLAASIVTFLSHYFERRYPHFNSSFDTSLQGVCQRDSMLWFTANGNQPHTSLFSETANLLFEISILKLHSDGERNFVLLSSFSYDNLQKRNVT